MVSFGKYFLIVSISFIFGYIMNALLTKSRNDQWMFDVMNHYQDLLEDKEMDEERKGEGYFVCLKCGQEIYQEDIGDIISGNYSLESFKDDTMVLKTDSTVLCKDCCED